MQRSQKMREWEREYKDELKPNKHGRKNAIVKIISAKEWVCVACLLHDRVRRPVEHLGIRIYGFWLSRTPTVRTTDRKTKIYVKQNKFVGWVYRCFFFIVQTLKLYTCLLDGYLSVFCGVSVWFWLKCGSVFLISTHYYYYHRFNVISAI